MSWGIVDVDTIEETMGRLVRAYRMIGSSGVMSNDDGSGRRALVDTLRVQLMSIGGSEEVWDSMVEFAHAYSARRPGDRVGMKAQWLPAAAFVVGCVENAPGEGRDRTHVSPEWAYGLVAQRWPTLAACVGAADWTSPAREGIKAPKREGRGDAVRTTQRGRGSVLPYSEGCRAPPQSAFVFQGADQVMPKEDTVKYKI